MAFLKSTILCKFSIQSATIFCRNVKTTVASRDILMKSRKDRLAQGLSKFSNAEGPLTDLPDYSFMDGRPTPLGSHQKRRLTNQRNLALRMHTLISEMDDGKDIYQGKLAEIQRKKEDIISNKFKPKGVLLLKKK